MAGKRRKRRAHGVGGTAAARSKRRQNSAALAGPVRSSPARLQSAARLSSGKGTETLGPLSQPFRAPAEIAGTPGPILQPPATQLGLLNRVPTVFLPGRVFFAMGRPVPGVVCCVLQASLLGWVPAVLWAVRAQRHLAAKQRGLAARLRPL
jgi:hypothetical protein